MGGGGWVREWVGVGWVGGLLGVWACGWFGG